MVSTSPSRMEQVRAETISQITSHLLESQSRLWKWDLHPILPFLAESWALDIIPTRGQVRHIPTSSTRQSFLVSMTSMSITDGNGTATSLTSCPVLVLLDTGTTLTYILIEARNNVLKHIGGGVIDTTNETSRNTDAGSYFTFEFSNTVGLPPIINVSITEIILPIPGGASTALPYEQNTYTWHGE